MKTGTIIKYLPRNTTQQDIEKIRKNFASKDHKLVLIISGTESILDNLCDFIKSRKI